MTVLGLSEALRLGSLTVDPAAGDIGRCAIAMVLAANGSGDFYLDDIGEEPDPDEELMELDENDPPLRQNEESSFLSLNVALVSHRALLTYYPWLENTSSDCPWCGKILRSTEMLHHPFDQHVIAGGVPMEALWSWIGGFEPQTPVPPPTRDIGLGVWFDNEEEKRAVIEAAAKAGMRPGSYVVAAVRLVLEQNISLDGYERSRPEILQTQDVSYAPYIGKQSDQVLV